ncbi:glycosyl transferase family 1 [Desulfuromonas versatilis]|uniref:Glycosyl transferase family 1 n=1 Tax=Desulfuromonas versatilis TaxID=2802975 RepID=A0ABM8HV48_9BACT|nr:glycosyltransferase family 4 protein [Desulfuromonas versatilis]BCR05793.1 glycosyl transferase family 1 [Desulfuromonas versatilis]
MTRALFAATVPETLKGFILPFAEHFRAQGWRVDGMAQGISGCSGCTAAFDRVWDVAWSRNPYEGKNLLQVPGAVREAVASGGYDLVHVHTPVASFVTRFSLRSLDRKLRPKVIYTAHGFHFYRGGSRLRNGLYLALEKLAGRWTDYLVVMNQEDLESAKKYRIVPPERVTYMPGIGVDTAYYSPGLVGAGELEGVRGEMGLQPEDRLFLMIAEFIPRKRHEDVLRAFASLDHPGAHLAFAGTGPLAEQMGSLAAELKLEKRVHFLGFRRDIPTLLKASAAVVLPSVHEGLPRSLMEALCLEVPCIGSNIRGTSDLLAGNRGLLVRVGDVEGLRCAMAWILENPGLAREMAARGKARMADYDIHNIIHMHEALYSRALAG